MAHITTVKEVKAYLGRARELDKQINMMILKKKSMRDALYGRAPGDQQGSRSSSSDALGKAIARVTDYEREIDRQIDTLVDIKIQISHDIDLITDPVQHEILVRKYLLFQSVGSRYDKKKDKTIKGIAATMNYTEQNVYLLLDKAVRQLASMLDLSVLKKI